MSWESSCPCLLHARWRQRASTSLSDGPLWWRGRETEKGERHKRWGGWSSSSRLGGIAALGQAIRPVQASGHGELKRTNTALGDSPKHGSFRSRLAGLGWARASRESGPFPPYVASRGGCSHDSLPPSTSTSYIWQKKFDFRKRGGQMML